MSDQAPSIAAAPAPAVPSSSAFLNGPPQEGASSVSSTEAIMAEALVAKGAMTAQDAAEGLRSDDAAGDTESEVAPTGIDANPYKTAQAAEAFAIGAGLDPDLSKFYSGRIAKALAEPAMSPEAQRQSCAETHQAMIDYFGDEAEGYINVARREVARLARDYPDLPQILERTNLGNDVHLIKSLIAHAANRELKARGYKV